MNRSPMSMPRPTSRTMLQLPSLRRRTTLPFPEVAVCRMENSAVVWLPYPEREKEETEFVIVTQCSFKCKEKFQNKKKKIESSRHHLVAEFIYCNHVFYVVEMFT